MALALSFWSRMGYSWKPEMYVIKECSCHRAVCVSVSASLSTLNAGGLFLPPLQRGIEECDYM